MSDGNFMDGIEKAIEIVEEKREVVRESSEKEIPHPALILTRIIEDLKEEVDD